MRTLLTALVTLSGCQAAKRKLDDPARQDRDYAQGRVKLTALRNEGAAFGLPVPRCVVLGGSAAALGALLCRRKDRPVSTGLILGGGLSNLLERLNGGSVYDYVQFPKAPEPLRNYVFNLADFAIFAGGLGLLLRRKK